MLRSVLGTPRSESDGNLLQLAEKSNGEESGGDEGPLAVAPGARRTADSSVVDDDGEEPPRALPTGAEAVITQVNTRQGAPTGPALGQMVTLPSTPEDTSDLRASWRNKVRNIFCCLVPGPGDQYTRQEEGPVVIRPVAPPPPSWADPVIGPPSPADIGKKCLVLDLDETLVHSSFRPVASPDYIIPVEIEGRVVDVYVLKRPHVDAFLAAVGDRFEVVVFTASLGKYADPLLDLLDPAGVVRWRLFREACYPYEGSYVKDLQCMGRPMESLIIVDNSPHSYVFQPENALPIGTFIDDPEDQELLDCLEVLMEVENARDVRQGLATELSRRRTGLFSGFSQAVARASTHLARPSV
ncbi:hypothetical protein ACKKBG_A21530 [Auxenochlorella protothecoides x Auxenochlorella symbiontica]